MKQLSYTKKAAIRIIITAAKDYEENLAGNNYIFIYKNRKTNSIEFFESEFMARNFQHLTGVDYIDSNGTIIKNASSFYKKCLNNALKESEIVFRKDGTTYLKLAALPLIINFIKSSKMVAIYNELRPKLAIDKLAGTTNFCLGFALDNNGYYVPSSALLEDIRNLTEEAFQVLAIMAKSASLKEPVYKTIKYVAKGVALDKLTLSDALSKKISLENYVPKEK